MIAEVRTPEEIRQAIRAGYTTIRQVQDIYYNSPDDCINFGEFMWGGFIRIEGLGPGYYGATNFRNFDGGPPLWHFPLNYENRLRHWQVMWEGLNFDAMGHQGQSVTSDWIQASKVKNCGFYYHPSPPFIWGRAGSVNRLVLEDLFMGYNTANGQIWQASDIDVVRGLLQSTMRPGDPFGGGLEIWAETHNPPYSLACGLKVDNLHIEGCGLFVRGMKKVTVDRGWNNAGILDIQDCTEVRVDESYSVLLNAQLKVNGSVRYVTQNF